MNLIVKGLPRQFFVFTRFHGEPNQIICYRDGGELQSDTMERIDELKRRNTLDESKAEQLILKVDIAVTGALSKVESLVKSAGGKISDNQILQVARGHRSDASWCPWI